MTGPLITSLNHLSLKGFIAHLPERKLIPFRRGEHEITRPRLSRPRERDQIAGLFKKGMI